MLSRIGLVQRKIVIFRMDKQRDVIQFILAMGVLSQYKPYAFIMHTENSALTGQPEQRVLCRRADRRFACPPVQTKQVANYVR